MATRTICDVCGAAAVLIRRASVTLPSGQVVLVSIDIEQADNDERIAKLDTCYECKRAAIVSLAVKR